MIYLLDTNIISYLLEGNMHIRKKFENLLTEGNEVRVPDMTYYEVMRGLLYKDSKKIITKFEIFCDYYGIIHSTFETYKKAAAVHSDLRKHGKTIDDGDIFISALSIENNMPVITCNVKHFGLIGNLSVVDWN